MHRDRDIRQIVGRGLVFAGFTGFALLASGCDISAGPPPDSKIKGEVKGGGVVLATRPETAIPAASPSPSPLAIRIITVNGVK